MGRRGRFSELEKRKILEDWKQSRLSAREFVRERGKPALETLLSWSRAERNQTRAFAPLRVVEGGHVGSSETPLCLSLGSAQIRFAPSQVSPEWVASLMRALQ